MNVTIEHWTEGHWAIRVGGDFGTIIGQIKAMGNRRNRRFVVRSRMLNIDATVATRREANRLIREAANQLSDAAV